MNSTRERDLLIVDAICDRFEKQLRNGECPCVGTFIQKAAQSIRSTLGRELVIIESEFLLSRNMPIDIERWIPHVEMSRMELQDLLTQAANGMADTLPDQPSSSRIDADCQRAEDDLALSELALVRTRIQHIDRFQLLETVGRGAFAVVWKGYDPALDRVVAIKIPHEAQRGSDALDRFSEEARICAQLVHPNIVQVYEVGQSKNVPYLVSEYVEGKSLANVKSQIIGDFCSITSVCAAIADALSAAHAKGIVHRDLKPGNVIIDEHGIPHLIDFGLSKRQSNDSSLTISGTIIGTPSYMSPELAMGNANKADGRSDIYSLGIMMYELLTGTLPFPSSPKAVLYATIYEQPPPLSAMERDVPHGLQAICLRALAKDPGSRQQTATEFAESLRDWQRVFQSNEYATARSAMLDRLRVVLFRHHQYFAAVLLGLVTLLVVIYSSRPHFRQADVGNIELAESLAHDAILASRKGEHTRVVKLMGDALAIHENYEWLCERAYSYLRLGQCESALLDCERVLAKSPTHARAHYVRYLVLTSLNRPLEADRSLKSAAVLGDRLAKLECDAKAQKFRPTLIDR